MVDFQILNDPEGRRVLVFSVASRPMGLPVQVDGVAWWYEGDSLIPMPENVRRRIYEETGIDFSGSVCEKAKISDLDETAIDAFRNKWIEKSGNRRLAIGYEYDLDGKVIETTDPQNRESVVLLFNTFRSLKTGHAVIS